MIPLGAGVLCVLGWHLMGSAGYRVAWLKPQSVGGSAARYRIGAIICSLPRVLLLLGSSLRSPVSSALNLRPVGTQCRAEAWRA